MSQQQKQPQKTHVLDINHYSLDELLDLFQLGYDMTPNDITQAKKKVLMLHPDKSKLPPEYFIFYKRAFVKIVELFDDLQKHNRPMTKEATKYNADVLSGRGGFGVGSVDGDGALPKLSDETRKTINSREFNRTFNELFEKNMLERPDEARNAWFHDEAPEYTQPDAVSKENMAQSMETVRQRAAENALTAYRGIREYSAAGAAGATRLYGGGAATAMGDDDEYISAPDLFRGLKFDDIRKVHKNETVIPVNYTAPPPSAIRKMTVDEYVASRAPGDEMPMAQREAERILAEKSQLEKQAILAKQYQAGIRTSEYAKKNREVVSHLLRLGNG